MIRPELIDSFSADLQSQGMLDQYQLRGTFASWWFDHYASPTSENSMVRAMSIM
jgi:hypothetical protein